MTDEEIMRTSPPELANLPDDFWASAVLVPPIPKQAISLRVDDDVLDWFRKQGPGYQSRMNAILRAYMQRMRLAKRPTRKKNRARG
ncbi:MAG: BrnA antitoxin family protein [Gemmatimonadaceae bacterium]|nr:BrnA antitoxin family protein [Gemmatimonadaceae bacterium]